MGIGSLDQETLHRVLHFGTVTLALSLFLVSMLAYRRDGRRSLLYVSAGFLTFTLKEAALFVGSLMGGISIPTVPAEVAHVLSLSTLIFFSLGIFRK